MKQVIWMFSGQGSQYYQMGRELFEHEPVFRDCVERGDAVVRECIHESVIEVIYRNRPDRFEPFARVLHTHPAILLLECAMARLLQHRGMKPDLLLGYSLGELATWVVAEAVSLEDALRIAVRHAEMIEYCVPAGGMLAILDQVDLLDRCPEIGRGCELAGINFERNFVITGSRDAIQSAATQVKAMGVSCIELPVAHPFHSTSMDLVGTCCRRILDSLNPGTPRLPLLSATRPGVITRCDTSHLWAATQGRIDFRERMRDLEQIGPYFYVDLGPSGSLATAVKYNLAPGTLSEFCPIMTPFGQDRRGLDRLMAAQQRFLQGGDAPAAS